MSKITNDGLTRSGTGWFIAIHIMAAVGVKGLMVCSGSAIPVHDRRSADRRVGPAGRRRQLCLLVDDDVPPSRLRDDPESDVGQTVQGQDQGSR